MEKGTESGDGRHPAEGVEGQGGSRADSRLALLSVGQREWYEERAAMLEFCGMMSQKEAERIALDEVFQFFFRV